MAASGSDTTRWLFADQLGPHFDDGEPILLIEAKSVFSRRVYHRQKAHLILSALRHRQAEDPTRITLLHSDSYRDGLSRYREQTDHVISGIAATSRPARRLVESLSVEQVGSERGWFTQPSEFQAWVNGRGKRRLLMEDWYRTVRKDHRVLMDGEKPEGGRWNFDSENRLPPPKGHTHLPVPEPWQPVEDDIDREVRNELDAWEAEGIRFLGIDGPRRFAVTRSEAMEALEDFLDNRLLMFGPYEDAVLWRDPFMAHSLLSVPLNLGLLHPREVVERAEVRWQEGRATLASVEGLIRQIIGWREYVWHLYWHLGAGYETRNDLHAEVEPPEWFLEASADEVDAACLRHSLGYVRDLGYSHHIVRLMVLSNWGLQRGYSPQSMNDWFRRAFVDGYPWVMTANVIGMGLYADGGVMATKPYVSGGAYLKKMTDFCGDCRYNPKVRVGEDACPFTAGYWAFLNAKRELLAGNHRLATAFRTLDKLADREALIEQEQIRGEQAP
jgi:deoxyribodipyrimidine photolyase-related protein